MKTLIVITGPTGVGKSDAAIAIAKRLNTEIISADSRQIYKGIPIGSATPDITQLKAVKHHFIAELELGEYFSAAQFEDESLKRLETIFATHDYAVVSGGSMMYVDALCKGIDQIPTITPDIREAVIRKYNEDGISAIDAELLMRDPEYHAIVDRNNHKRVIHAVEICRQVNGTYTSLRTGKTKQRPFKIIKIGLNIPRDELFDKINRRVDVMLERGLEAEARSVYHLRNLNSLNTVGYKEMFSYFDGTLDLATATEKIKRNTRVYAKKQLTWYARDPDMIWITPDDAHNWSPEAIL